MQWAYSQAGFDVTRGVITALGTVAAIILLGIAIIEGIGKIIKRLTRGKEGRG
jgi:hypothetical protein